jgi:hypothetical protein
MRPSFFLFLLLCILALTACGGEEELTPPAFSNITVKGAADTSIPFKDPSVTIAGAIDDVSATLVASSTAIGEVPVAVNSSDGSWSFNFAPLTAGANIISFTASDKSGNINQMILTVLHDPTPPSVSSVTLSMDPQNFDILLLNVTFDEVLATLSPAAIFSVVDNAGALIAGPFTVTLTTPSTVILPLAAETPPGTYRLICPDPGVSDLAGNSVAVDYLFTIQ